MKLFEQAYKVLKPGGWVESFEASPTIESDDDTVKPDSALGQWGPIFIKASKMIGNTFTVVADDLQRKGVEHAGFTEIKQWDSKVCSSSKVNHESMLMMILPASLEPLPQGPSSERDWSIWRALQHSGH